MNRNRSFAGLFASLAVLFCGAVGTQAQSFTNPSFETPSITGYTYTPSGSSWMFTNNAGIQKNGSAYSGTQHVAPGGTQTALLQSAGGTLGTMSQSVSFPAGTYTISFQASRRWNTLQPVRVSVGSTVVGTFSPAGDAFQVFTTDAFSVGAGSHTVTLAATDSAGDKTTLIDLLSIASSGGGGGQAPPVPTALTATSGNAQVSLAWNASTGATSYNVYRGTAPGAQSGTAIATGITATSYTNTGLTNGTAYYYKVRAVNSSGTSGDSNEASATPSVPGGGGGGSASFLNADFETPTLSGYSYNPSGSSWTFTNNAGIQKNGSAYSGSTHFAPFGVQTAFVQGVGGTLGTMSQSVTFPGGIYTISFHASRRYGTVQPVRVSVNGTVVGTYTPASNNFAQITTDEFVVSAGSYTVTFAATDNSADKSSFIDQVSITNTSGGGSAPAAPTGLSASAGNGQVSLSWTASPGASSYSVYRGTSSNGQGGTAIATGVSTTAFTNTGLTNGTTYYYKVRALNSNGTSGDSNEASATPSSGGGSGVFANASFETPSITGFSYTPTGTSWSFTSNSGIQRNGSAFSGTDHVAPGGVQTAFLQGNGGLGTMSQSVNFAAGNYTISFHAARRWGSVQPVRVSVGGTVIGTYTPASGGFAQITTASFAVAAGSHTVSFAATDSTGDKSTFVDLVSIGAGSGGSAPSAPTGLAATSGNGQVNLSWTASSGAATYNVYRGTASNGQSGTPIATGITATSYVNTGLTNGTAYYYKVRAVNSFGTSGNSNEASATPSAGGSGDIDLTGYTLTFSDEFDSLSVTTNSPKGASKWYYLPPYGSAGFYSASTWDINALSVMNGILHNRAYIGEEPGTWGTYWYSGNISSVDETGAGFSQLYGYFAARIKMPDSGNGAWPAFWLVSKTGIPAVSPTPVKVSEIDILEWYGICNTPGAYQPYMQQASHNWNEDGSQNPANHLYSPQTPMPGGAYPWEGFHIYGCKIDPQHITWYIDGIQTNQINTPTEYLTAPYYIMVDYALGGGWPLTGMVDGSEMLVDWVRVYSLPGL